MSCCSETVDLGVCVDNPVGEFSQRASDALDYSMDWSAWLDTGDGINGTPTTTSPTGITVGTPVVNGNVVTVRVSGGVLGYRYSIGIQITTDSGQTRTKYFYVEIVPG